MCDHGIEPTLRHMRGKETIMACFGVSSRTVSEWIRCGAPIYYQGRKYQANYERLSIWLERKFRKRPAAAPRRPKPPEGEAPKVRPRLSPE